MLRGRRKGHKPPTGRDAHVRHVKNTATAENLAIIRKIVLILHSSSSSGVTKHVWYRKCGSLTTLSTCQLWYNAKYQQTSHHSLQWTPPHCVLPSCGKRARRGAATGAMKQEVQTTAGQIIEHAGGHHSDARKELRWSPF